MSFPTYSSWVVKLLFSLLLIAGCMQRVQALQVDDLYVADVLVSDESASQLKRGARAGLLQVLVRVSGVPSVEESSLIRSSLRDPAAYYYQFSYEATEKVLLAGAVETPAKNLRLHFDPSAIARLLRDANLPVWGSNRPGVLLWIAVNEGQNRRILSDADESELVDSLVDQARQRGVPLLFPILDLEDASKISAAEVWGSFLERIEQASLRYRPDAVLTARVQQEFGGRFTLRWAYLVNDQWVSLENASVSSNELVRTMVNELSDELAVRFALGSSKASVNLIVEGVVTVGDYAAVSQYLEQLTPVLNSSIVSLQGDVAEFKLQTEGQYEQLVEIIELDERLQLLSQDESNGRLLYRWAQ